MNFTQNTLALFVDQWSIWLVWKVSGFHCSAYDGDANELSLGDEVEFVLSRKVGKVSAECLRKLQKGSVAPEDVSPEVIDGKILRCMRIINPEQEEYPGIVQVGTDSKAFVAAFFYCQKKMKT